MNKPSLNVAGEQSRTQSILISLGLVYLAIPNLLFLQGWFEPWFACIAALLILFAVGRAIGVSMESQAAPAATERQNVLALILGLLTALFICLYLLVRSGLLGFVQSYGDLEILRNAMFANLRDDAWPLILPNGKEMSYYLAQVLPSAMLARLMPHSGQWPVVLWTLPAMLLVIAMVTTQMPARLAWGWKFALCALFLAIFGCSYASPHWLNAGVQALADFLPFPIHVPIPGRTVVCGQSLSGCGGVYNSYPPSLLLAAILLTCRHRAEVILPVALALTVPLSPFGGVALCPLVALRWWESIRQNREFKPISLLPDALLPLAMVTVCALYFLRADGENVVSLTLIAWGWKSYLLYDGWRIAGWMTLLLPLWFCVKRDAFFYTFVLCYILMAAMFIGTMPQSGCGRNNELWLKAAPCYMLITATYWLTAWSRLHWCKHIVLALCILMTAHKAHQFAQHFGENRYLVVDDCWSGHMNHDDPFFNQSLPRCHEPMLPGFLLREGGESERHFPGNMLPEAPGCDYSRPAQEEHPLRWGW